MVSRSSMLWRSKVMVVARKLRLADQFDVRPLIYTTLLKSAAFTVVLACFKILEEAALGMYRGETFRASIAESVGEPGREFFP